MAGVKATTPLNDAYNEETDRNADADATYTSEQEEELRSLELSQLRTTREREEEKESPENPENPENSVSLQKSKLIEENMGNEMSETNNKEEVNTKDAGVNNTTETPDTQIRKDETDPNARIPDRLKLTEEVDEMEVEIDIRSEKGTEVTMANNDGSVKEVEEVNGVDGGGVEKIKIVRPTHLQTPNRRLTRTRSGMGSVSLRKTIFSPSQSRR